MEYKNKDKSMVLISTSSIMSLCPSNPSNIHTKMDLSKSKKLSTSYLSYLGKIWENMNTQPKYDVESYFDLIQRDVEMGKCPPF
jgi:hypothetical protein